MYKCQLCGQEVIIRTGIKNRDSEFYGKKACSNCASKHNIQKETKTYQIKSRTEKTNNNRKEERKDYPEFFQKHIQIIQENQLCCENCGDKLFGDSSNVAHIVSKSSNKEVATLDDNILYLCGLYSRNNCHSIFDSNFGNREKMKVFPLAVEKFNRFKDKIIKITKEVLHYEES